MHSLTATHSLGSLQPAPYFRPWLRFFAPVDGDAGGGGTDGEQQQQQPTEGEQQQQQEPADLTQMSEADLRAELARVRREAADRRVTARTEKERADAAAAERAKLAGDIAKLLGIKTDEVTPEMLQQQLGNVTQERDSVRSEAAELRRENLVHRLAPVLGVDSSKLVDSRSFLASIATVDPSDSKASESINEAIKKALQGNPALALVKVPGSSGSANHTGDDKQKPKSLAGAVTAAYGTQK